MTDSLSKSLATPREFKLNGTTYKITPITLNDLAAYEQYCKDNIRESLLAMKDISKREIIQEIIASEREGIDIDKSLGSMDGVRFLFWRSLKQNHEELSIEDAGALVSINNMDLISSMMMDSDDKGGPNDKKKQTENLLSGTS